VQTAPEDRQALALTEAARPDVALVPERSRSGARSVVEPKPVAKTRPIEPNESPEDMVYVPGGDVHMKLGHMRRECGCYPDPGTPPEQWREFLWGSPFDATLDHEYVASTEPFFIDEAEVTNAQFKSFLDETGYRPEHAENFLKHWPDGIMPDDLADLPVVYVDLEDARAYARFVG
jgi:formylglycine-generating enzyme required for sulfatase activity